MMSPTIISQYITYYMKLLGKLFAVKCQIMLIYKNNHADSKMTLRIII
jgi:hypothetical protein